jgi:hypothetical protein
MVQQCHAWCSGCHRDWFWLGSAAEICQTLGMRLCQDHMACPKSATQSHLDIAISSLIGPIWRK